MYIYCIDNNFGSGWNEKWGVKHFKIFEDNLLDNEDVKMTFIGLNNYKSPSKHDGNFAFAITNKRIMMGQKKSISGEIFQSVYLDNINDITFSSNTLTGMLNIDTSKETITISLDKGSAKSINSKIHEIFEEVRHKPKEIIEDKSSNISMADEIKKFKELLDMGVLTQEEFDAKKKQLLGI